MILKASGDQKVKLGQNSLQRHQFAVALQHFCEGLGALLLNVVALKAGDSSVILAVSISF